MLKSCPNTRITLHSMRMLGLSKEQCLEFIKRQANTAQLTPGKKTVLLLLNNMLETYIEFFNKKYFHKKEQKKQRECLVNKPL